MASLHTPEESSPLVASSHLLRSSQYDLRYWSERMGAPIFRSSPLSFFEGGRITTVIFRLSGASIVHGREVDKRGRVIAVGGKDDNGICGFTLDVLPLSCKATAYPSSGGIVLDYFSAVELAHLNLSRTKPASRSSDPVEDDLALRMLCLDAHWWPSWDLYTLH